MLISVSRVPFDFPIHEFLMRPLQMGFFRPLVRTAFVFRSIIGVKVAKIDTIRAGRVGWKPQILRRMAPYIVIQRQTSILSASPW